MMYVVTVNLLAQAINNKEHIRPENLIVLPDMGNKPDASKIAGNRQENAENGLLYPDTEKELFLSDYKPLPRLDNMNKSMLYALLDNITSAAENAFCYHAEMLACALIDDIETVKTEIDGRN